MLNKLIYGVCRQIPYSVFGDRPNKAENIIHNENKKEMTIFLKNIGSNHILQNRQLVFQYKLPYKLVAEQSEATNIHLQNSHWCARMDLNRRPRLYKSRALTN